MGRVSASQKRGWRVRPDCCQRGVLQLVANRVEFSLNYIIEEVQLPSCNFRFNILSDVMVGFKNKGSRW